MYGLSDKTVRRWIRAGKLRADMRDGAYSVSPDEVSALLGRVSAQASAPGADTGTGMGADGSEGDVRPSEPAGTDIMRAEAMAAYTRSVLEPLVAALERSEDRTRELERQVGRLQAENDALRASNATLDAPGSTQATEPASETFVPWYRRWDWVAAALGVLLVGAGAGAILAGR
jgi:hypothetical protein